MRTIMRLISLLFLSVFFAPANVMANDADADGVEDKLDKCPNTAQLKKLPADFKYGVAVDPVSLELDIKATEQLRKG